MKITDELRYEVRRHITSYFEKISRHRGFRRRIRTEEEMARHIGCSFKVFTGWYNETRDDCRASDEEKIIRWAWRQFYGLQKKFPDLLPGFRPKATVPVRRAGPLKSRPTLNASHQSKPDAPPKVVKQKRPSVMSPPNPSFGQWFNRWFNDD